MARCSPGIPNVRRNCLIKSSCRVSLEDDKRPTDRRCLFSRNSIRSVAAATKRESIRRAASRYYEFWQRVKNGGTRGEGGERETNQPCVSSTLISGVVFFLFLSSLGRLNSSSARTICKFLRKPSARDEMTIVYLLGSSDLAVSFDSRASIYSNLWRTLRNFRLYRRYRFLRWFSLSLRN